MAVEKFRHVMHLVSEISGYLRHGKTAIDALAACLPAGTVSGAPKGESDGNNQLIRKIKTWPLFRSDRLFIDKRKHGFCTCDSNDDFKRRNSLYSSGSWNCF